MAVAVVAGCLQNAHHVPIATWFQGAEFNRQATRFNRILWRVVTDCHSNLGAFQGKVFLTQSPSPLQGPVL